MKKIKIIKNGQVTNEATFDTEELLNEWYYREVSNLSFGHPERVLIDFPGDPVSEDLKAIAIEVNQVEIDGVSYNEYKIPSEFSYEITDITEEVAQASRIQEKMQKGEYTSKVCKDAFNLIAGYNIDRAMTSEQKDQMATLFAPIVQALKIYERPSLAKSLVANITPDGVLVTEQMKADMLELLKEF